MIDPQSRSVLSTDSRISRRVLARFVGAKGIGVGDTIEEGSVRIHRSSGAIRITDLTNAGKRGKKCSRIAVLGKHFDDSLVEPLAELIGGNQTFAQIVALVKKWDKEHPNQLEIHEHEDRGVDTMPGGFAPLLVRGAHITVEVGYKDFRITDVMDEDQNGTVCTPASKGGPKDIPAFYRWVKDNSRKIQSMTFHEMLQEMKALGVNYHQYCSID